MVIFFDLSKYSKLFNANAVFDFLQVDYLQL